jgi:hypothetical protein
MKTLLFALLALTASHASANEIFAPTLVASCGTSDEFFQNAESFGVLSKNGGETFLRFQKIANGRIAEDEELAHNLECSVDSIGNMKALLCVGQGDFLKSDKIIIEASGKSDLPYALRIIARSSGLIQALEQLGFGSEMKSAGSGKVLTRFYGDEARKGNGCLFGNQ